MSELTDKVVLVTGAGLGFGRKLAIEFAHEGAIVAANDQTPVNLDEVVAEIVEKGGQAKSYLADVAKKVAVQMMVTDIVEYFGRIDILINQANVNPNIPLLDMDEWDWRRALEVNLTGTFLTMQSVGRVMRELGGGSIVNIVSQTEQSDEGHSTSFRSANAGIIELTRQAAKELAQHNIRVSAVCTNGDELEECVKQVLALCSEDDNRTGETLNCV